MEFVIHRTSVWDDEISPHPKAYQKKVTRVDARTFKSPAEHDAKIPGEFWLSKGKNHRKYKDGIARDFDATTWCIKISTLEELVKFSEEVGELVVSCRHFMYKEEPSIEIYDTYRE